MTDDQIRNNFKYHAPKEGQPEKYEALREKGRELAFLIQDLCPESREKSLAFTQLEQAIFWANASIARDGEAKTSRPPNPPYLDPATHGRPVA